MAYKVIASFRDLQDNEHKYFTGDTYPREGLTPTKERIEALASGKNAFNTKFIEYVKEPKKRSKK